MPSDGAPRRTSKQPASGGRASEAVGGAPGERLDGERGVVAAARREDRTVDRVQVGDAVEAVVGVHHARVGIVAVT